jgi:hypothetical protein
MLTVENEEKDDYFVQAIAPFNVADSTGKYLLEIYRGQYFKWDRKTVDVELDGGCLTCSQKTEEHIIIGYFDCEEGFKDSEGNPTEYRVPSYVFTETYDIEDALDTRNPGGDKNVCESFIHETGGYNKDLFTPPHLRDEYDDWRQNSPNKSY